MKVEDLTPPEVIRLVMFEMNFALPAYIAEKGKADPDDLRDHRILLDGDDDVAIRKWQDGKSAIPAYVVARLRAALVAWRYLTVNLEHQVPPEYSLRPEDFIKAWFRSWHPSLGMCPAEALRLNRYDEVITAARECPFVKVNAARPGFVIVDPVAVIAAKRSAVERLQKHIQPGGIKSSEVAHPIFEGLFLDELRRLADLAEAKENASPGDRAALNAEIATLHLQADHRASGGVELPGPGLEKGLAPTGT